MSYIVNVMKRRDVVHEATPEWYAWIADPQRTGYYTGPVLLCNSEVPADAICYGDIGVYGSQCNRIDPITCDVCILLKLAQDAD